MADPSGGDGRGRAPRDASARAVRRRRGDRHRWFALFAGLALLGLLVMPIDYRGGAEQAHAHSLLQLVLDASDGTVRHEHTESMPVAGAAAHQSWFDPGAPLMPAHHVSANAETHVDTGSTPGSVGAYSSIPFLLAALVAVTIAVRLGGAIALDGCRPRGRVPRILVPPPRLAIAS